MLKCSSGLVEPWMGTVSLSSSSIHVFLSWPFMQFSFISPHSLAQITYDHAMSSQVLSAPGPFELDYFAVQPCLWGLLQGYKVGIVTAGSLPLLTEEGIKPVTKAKPLNTETTAPLWSWIIVSICFTSCFHQQCLFSFLLLRPIKYQSSALPSTSKHLTSASIILSSSVSTLKSSDGGRSDAHPNQRDTALFLEQVHSTVFWLFFYLALSPARQSKESLGNVNTTHNFYVQASNRHNVQNIFTSILLFSYSLIRELPVQIYLLLKCIYFTDAKVQSSHWCGSSPGSSTPLSANHPLTGFHLAS